MTTLQPNIPASTANRLGIPVDQPHSLQATIELVYVRAANDLLYNHLAVLDSYLSTTQQALNILSQLQTLHNDLVVNSKGKLSAFAATMGLTNYLSSASNYQKVASAFFGTAVLVSGQFNFPSFLATIKPLLTTLSTVTIPALSGSQVRLSGGAIDPNGLYAQIKTVLNDLNTVGGTGVTSGGGGNALQWIIDNYNAVGSGATTAGQYQTDLTNAITAGTSLNTTQTESVRNFLYLFEEYYKSATSMLQQITQTIQKMADHISG